MRRCQLLSAFVTGALVLWLLSAPAFALDAGRALSQLDERTWGVRDGLPQASVTALAQSPDGYLWVGTDGGLARFDGHRFTTFDAANTAALAVHRIRALHVDGRGDLWIGVDGGNSLLRYRAGRFEQVGVRRTRVSPLFEDRAGRLWGLTFAAALRIVDGRAETVPRIGGAASGQLRAMAEDAQGGLWLGGARGLTRIEGGRARRFSREDGAPTGVVSSLLWTPEGILWIGTETEGLFRWQGDGFRPVGGDQRLSFLLRDRQGTVWAAGQRGVGRVRGDAIEWAEPGSTLAAPAQVLLEDREGNLWVGRSAFGLLRLSQGTMTALPPAWFGGHRTSAVMAARDGAVYVASEGAGVLRVHGESVERLSARDDGLCTDTVWSMAQDSAGALWFGGTGRGATLCQQERPGGTFRSFGSEEGVTNKDIHAISPQEDGSILLGTGGGVFEGRDGRFRRLEGPPGTPLQHVVALRRDRSGTLWVSANGLYARSPDGRWRRYGAAEGLPNNLVFSIDEDQRGRLWLGTKVGLTRIADGRLTTFGARQGLLDDSIYKTLFDDRGGLWLSSSKGVLRVTAEAPLRYEHFDGDDGLKTDQCEGGRQSAGARDPRGRLWFATAAGAAFVDPQRLPAPTTGLSLVIESVSLDDRPLLGWRVRVGQGNLQVEYTAPALTRPEALRFRYRLEPFDRDWVEAGARRAAYYTNVPPGRYRFVVGAFMVGAPTELVTARFELQLTPRWTQTVWARVAMAASIVIALAVAGWLWHRRRMLVVDERHRAILAERNRIARDLHDTLAQGFTGISVQLEAAVSRLPADAAPARENLDQARALVRASLVDARRAVWDIRPTAAEEPGLVPALSQIARNLSAAVPVRVQVNGQARPLPPPFELALVRIGQEALTNALRHAQATNITLEITFLSDAIHLRVSDDGKGFQPGAGGGQGMGLEGLHERARALKGDLMVRSQPGAGTELVLKAPLPTVMETTT